VSEKRERRVREDREVETERRIESRGEERDAFAMGVFPQRKSRTVRKL
jgi:hypothetical protein